MVRKMKFLVLLASLVFALWAGMAAAQESASTQGAPVTLGRVANLTVTTPGSDVAQGGNVSELNMSTQASTTKWQGYYGSVLANLSLGDGTDQLFRFANNVDTIVESVLATTNTTLNLGNLGTVDSEAEQAGADNALDFNSTDADSVNRSFGAITNRTILGFDNTFVLNLTAYTPGAAGAQTCNSSNVGAPDTYNAGLLEQASTAMTATAEVDVDNLIWAVDTDLNRCDFRTNKGQANAPGVTIDYELIVASGATTNAPQTTRTYNFFLALGTGDKDDT